MDGLVPPGLRVEAAGFGISPVKTGPFLGDGLQPDPVHPEEVLTYDAKDVDETSRVQQVVHRGCHVRIGRHRAEMTQMSDLVVRVVHDDAVGNPLDDVDPGDWRDDY